MFQSYFTSFLQFLFAFFFCQACTSSLLLERPRLQPHHNTTMAKRKQFRPWVWSEPEIFSILHHLLFSILYFNLYFAILAVCDFWKVLWFSFFSFCCIIYCSVWSLVSHFQVSNVIGMCWLHFVSSSILTWHQETPIVVLKSDFIV